MKQIISSATSKSSFSHCSGCPKPKKGTADYKRLLVMNKLFKHYHRWEQGRDGNWHTYGTVISETISCDKNGNLIKK